MKRMYLVLSIMFLLVFWAGALLGQQGSRPIVDDETETFEKRLKIREEIHRRMMEKLLRGVGPDQDMFSDVEKMMDDMMKDSFSGMQSISGIKSSNYKMEWKESNQGRTLEITPANPSQHLDINVANGLITIKGKEEKGSFVSSFSNAFSVPGDCDPAKVKMDQKDGKILVSFPYIAARPIKKSTPDVPKRVPLPPSQGDVQI